MKTLTQHFYIRIQCKARRTLHSEKKISPIKWIPQRRNGSVYTTYTF